MNKDKLSGERFLYESKRKKLEDEITHVKFEFDNDDVLIIEKEKNLNLSDNNYLNTNELQVKNLEKSYNSKLAGNKAASYSQHADFESIKNVHQINKKNCKFFFYILFYYF